MTHRELRMNGLVVKRNGYVIRTRDSWLYGRVTRSKTRGGNNWDAQSFHDRQCFVSAVSRLEAITYLVRVNGHDPRDYNL